MFPQQISSPAPRRRIRRRVFELLELARPGDRASRITDIVILGLILANAFAVVLSTVDSFQENHARALAIFDTISIAFFTVEYLLRLWSSAELNPKAPAYRVRARYAVSWLAIVDLLAIIPAFLPLLLPVDLRALRLLRFFRLLRLLKIGRYSLAIQTFSTVLRVRREELTVSILALFILLFITSTLMYFVENPAQPDLYTSIPAAMWWGVSALTTVGYGDIHPLTPLGKMLGALSSILGIGLFAVPAGILASGFSEVYSLRRSSQGICPTCGKKICDE
jgi:voltage-gated potassium channel